MALIVENSTVEYAQMPDYQIKIYIYSLHF